MDIFELPSYFVLIFCRGFTGLYRVVCVDLLPGNP
jgi:hypothetical protein